MGIEVTAATFTCDKCGTNESTTSLKLPDGWSQVRTADNRQVVLCTTDTTALNSFFTSLQPSQL